MQKDIHGGFVGYREGMTRREVFASAAVAGAGIVLAPVLDSARRAEAAGAAGEVSRAQPVITRTIPRTNEALPAIGLGAYLTFDEDVKGSPEPGKLGDMAVLSDDPLTCTEARLPGITADLTIVGGRVVYER